MSRGAWIAYALAVAIALTLSIPWQVLAHAECRAVGHSSFYCGVRFPVGWLFVRWAG